MTSDVVMWSMILFASTVCTFLMIALIAFERSGGDPQKRSLGNRLVSNNLIIILVLSWTRNSFLVLAR